MNDDSAVSLNSKRKQKPLQDLVYPNVSSSLRIVLDEVVRLLNEGRMERWEEKCSKGKRCWNENKWLESRRRMPFVSMGSMVYSYFEGLSSYC
jgi:hypothetical protein